MAGIRQGCFRNATQRQGPQQEVSRAVAGMQRKRQWSQQELGRAVTGMQRKRRHSATTDTHRDRSRSSAGLQPQMRTGNGSRKSSRIRQGCSRNAAADAYRERSRNAAKTTGCSARTQHKFGRAVAQGTQQNRQERSRNFGRTVAGMQQQMRRRNAAKNDRGRSKNSAGIRQRCRNAAKMDAWEYIRYVEGTKQGCSRNAAKTTVVAAGTQQELGRAV